MSSDMVKVSARKREEIGKKVKKLRADGFVPGTVYEKGKESISVAVEYVPMVKAYSAVGLSQPIELSVDKKNYLTMIKDIHMDPVRNELMHVSFHAVNKNDPVEAEVPVHLNGDAPAVSKGNFINRPNDVVSVKALPADLPEVLNVDLSGLENPGDTLTVADLDVITNVEILSEPNMVLVVVEEPRVQEEEPEAAEAVDASDVPAANGGDKPEDSSETK